MNIYIYIYTRIYVYMMCGTILYNLVYYTKLQRPACPWSETAAARRCWPKCLYIIV